jgi:hypothetical protein
MMGGKQKKPSVVRFSCRILKYGKKGEKTGWTFIEVPDDVSERLFPGNRRSFRVKGKLDDYEINGVALLPMSGGGFIMPFNATMRKGTGKRDGAMLNVMLQMALKEIVLNRELMKCLADEPDALSFFKQLPKSHQNYFSKWIDTAKTPETKAKRIARTLNALSQKMHYGQMLQAGK